MSESEIQVRLALEAAELGVCEFDYEAWTITADRRISEITRGVLPVGVPVSLDGPEMTEINSRIHPEDRDAYWIAADAIRSGATSAYATTFRHLYPDGRCRWLKSRGLALDIIPGTGRPRRLVNIVMDVTATAEVEDRLERLVQDRTRALTETARELRAEMERRELAQAKLVQTQKMAALGQLTGGIIHDCNNVLGIITGVLGLINRKTSDSAIRRLAETGEQAVARAIGLFEHLLAFARRETLRPVRIDLNAMLAETRQLVRHAVGSQANVAVDVAPDLWPVAADKHRLEVALLNLAANARDAMPDGGTLTIAARNLPAGAPRAEACPAGDCVVISVADTGTGMPPDVLARALEPFFTTKGIGRGTGLGLAMVHGFATESNGGLAIRTAPGKGTAVDIFLPRNDTAGAEAAHDGSPHPSVDNHAQILVVDDDDLVRAVTTGLLEDMGYQVLAASNAEAGYALVHATPHIDLVLSDVVMPRVSGPAMAARLRADFPALRIVFMTGYRDRHDLDGESVLQKPFTPASLARFVAGSLTPTAGQ